MRFHKLLLRLRIGDVQFQVDKNLTNMEIQPSLA